MIEMNPDTIDFEMACRMTGASYTIDEPLTYKSNFFPRVIDFDELARIKPPRGYGFEVSRDLTIRTSSFRGLCWNAVHYYCDIDSYGLSLKKGDCIVGGYLGGLKLGRICRSINLQVNRIVTEEDLKDKFSDWDGYSVGDFTHRWYSSKNAIECAKACIKQRFRNYGKIRIDDGGAE